MKHEMDVSETREPKCSMCANHHHQESIWQSAHIFISNMWNAHLRAIHTTRFLTENQLNMNSN